MEKEIIENLDFFINLEVAENSDIWDDLGEANPSELDLTSPENLDDVEDL